MQIIVSCTYKVKPGMVDQLVKEIQDSGVEALYRSQPGNICFNYSTPANDKDTFYLLDIWESEEAFEAHRSCAAGPIWRAIKEKYVDETDMKVFEASWRK